MAVVVAAARAMDDDPQLPRVGPDNWKSVRLLAMYFSYIFHVSQERFNIYNKIKTVKAGMSYKRKGCIHFNVWAMKSHILKFRTWKSAMEQAASGSSS